MPPMVAARPAGLRNRAIREAWVFSVLAALAWVLASCSGSVPATTPTSPASPGKRLTWMLTKTALSQVVTDATVRARLEGSPVYQILRPGQLPLALVGAVPVVTFSAISDLERALTGGELPQGTQAVLYDPEVWPYTPAAEQRNPVQAARKAMTIAHAHGLKLIVAPALNLTMAQPSAGPRWQQFLHLDLAGAMAKVADVIELQAQSLEREPGTYAGFVREAAAQAQAAHPQVTVLAGLSTNPPGTTVSSQQLAAAIRATSGIVAGYWLNIPGRGPRCPTCNSPRPDIGRQILRDLP